MHHSLLVLGRSLFFRPLHIALFHALLCAVALTLTTAPVHAQDAPKKDAPWPVSFEVPKGHAGWIRSIDLSKDGTLLLSGGSDQSAKLWNTRTGRLVRSFFGHSKTVRSVALRVDAAVALTGGDDGTVRLWNVATGDLLRTIKASRKPILSVAYSPDGQKIASGGRNGHVNVWNISTGQTQASFKNHDEPVDAVRFHPSGTFLVSAGRSPEKNPEQRPAIQFHNLQSGKTTLTLQAPEGRVREIAFNKDGTRLAASLEQGPILVWDVAKDVSKATLIHTLKGHTNSSAGLRFTPDGTRLVSASFDRKMIVWDLKGGKAVATFQNPPGRELTSLVVEPSGKTAITGDASGEIKRWDLKSGKIKKVMDAPNDWVASVAITDDANLIAVARGPQVQIWHRPTGRILRAWTPHGSSRVSSVALSPDGTKVATGTRDGGHVSVWDVWDGKLIRALSPSKFGGFNLTFDPDGEKIAGATRNGSIVLWDIQKGEETRRVGSFEHWAQAVRIFGSNKRAISANRDNTLTTWDIRKTRPTKKDRKKKHPEEVPRRTLEGHSQAVMDIELSRTGKRAVSGSKDRTVRIWNARKGDLLHTLKGHRSRVTSVDITPNGKRAVSVSWDSTVRVWDAEEGKLIHTLTGHNGWISAVDMTPDGKYAVSGGQDRTFKIWDLDRGVLLTSSIGSEKGRFVTWTPSGHIERNGWPYSSLLGLVHNTQSVGDEQVFELLHDPIQVRRQLLGQPLTTSPRTILPTLRPTARARMRDLQLADEDSTGRAAKATVQTTSYGGGMRELRLYQNGKLIAQRPGGLKTSIPGASSTFEFDVQLAAGVNHFQSIAVNADGVLSKPSSYAVEFEVPDAKGPTLHVLAIGYGSASASESARMVKKTLSSRKTDIKAMYAKTDIKALVGNQATLANVQAYFKTLRSKAKPEDVFIFFFAGSTAIYNKQQVLDLDGRGDGGSLSLQTLRFAFKNIPCLTQLALLDLHTNQIDPLKPLADLDTKTISTFATTYGVTVFAGLAGSPSGEQKDTPGAFTQTLIHALNGSSNSARWKDGVLEIGELARFLYREMPAYARTRDNTVLTPSIYMNYVDGGLLVY